MIFGVAEDHDSNPIKIGLGKLKKRGAKIIGVNPVRTGYNAIADDWIGITPGTDGLFILSIVHTLFKAGKVDFNYLIRYTNAPFLVNDVKNTEETGLFLKSDNGKPVVFDKKSKKIVPFDEPGINPAITFSDNDADRSYSTVFELMAKKYLSEEYSPKNVEGIIGINANKIVSLANELANVAFEQQIVIDQEWTDWKGQSHKKMIGRPVSFHAMRGISAHSNGFQTCRSIHLLQLLLGSVEVPGGFRFKPPYPKPSTAHPKPHFTVTPGLPLDGPHLGFVHGPEDLAIKKDGTAVRIDKAFTWENPMSSHGLMHMVISNAHAGDPYKINTLFMYMANMAWNSSMNTKGMMKMLTDKNDNGDYIIPNIIYSDSYSSEMVAFADLILPDTTYLERHDCISLLDRPICEADSISDSIRWPVVEPDRDVKGFQSVLLELGAKLKLPGIVDDKGRPIYTDYADYIARHERRPGVGPLAGFRGKNGRGKGRGEPNPNQVQAYIENGGFWSDKIPTEAQYFKPWNSMYQKWAVDRGLFDKIEPYVFQIYVEPMRKFQIAAEGFGKIQPPNHLRKQIKFAMDPLPTWWSIKKNDKKTANKYPIHAITQRPAAMYHSWGSQNAWLRQIHGTNPLYVSKKIWFDHSFKEGDWAILTSEHGKIKVPVALMKALNAYTVWTWNAIGKRAGAWALDENAPEVKKGFLLNHLIHELLPAKGDGLRWSNSDPITGQAAWYDLTVKIEKVQGRLNTSEPIFSAQKSPVPKAPKNIKYGSEFK